MKSSGVCTISIIIPVFHESHIINHTLNHLYSQKFKQHFEIIIVDGTNTGDTLCAVKYDQVKKIRSNKGRGIQMNTGADHAKGDILLFLHADTILPIDGLKQIAKVIDEKKIMAGAFSLKINSAKKLFRIIEKTASFRSVLTKIPYGDQAVFIDKKLFFNIGGFKEIPIMEDVELMQRIKNKGISITIFPSQVKTSARRWENEGIFYGTFRNWMLITLYFMGISPDKLAKFYKSK